MKSKVLLLISILFFACIKEKSTVIESSDAKVKQESEEITVIKRSLDDLPSNLIMLTELKGDWVVFNPCDASNGEIIIQGQKMIWGEGHEAEELMVKNVAYIPNQFSLDIESLGKLYKNGIEISIDEKQQRYKIRNKLYGGDKTRVFVAKEKLSDYKVINQPCKECWDDCD